uniref:Uncharacterized protein n=1 Tax=Cacopsylla melanoneura TaxID=428564 RepID=A0A8D9E902_9HEMI
MHTFTDTHTHIGTHNSHGDLDKLIPLEIIHASFPRQALLPLYIYYYSILYFVSRNAGRWRGSPIRRVRKSCHNYEKKNTLPRMGFEPAHSRLPDRLSVA